MLNYCLPIACDHWVHYNVHKNNNVNMFDIKDIIEVVLILYYKVQRPDDLWDSLEPIHNHHQYTFFLLLRGKFINVKCILQHQKFIEMFILLFSFNFFRSILIDKLQNTYIIIYKFSSWFTTVRISIYSNRWWRRHNEKCKDLRIEDYNFLLFLILKKWNNQKC